MKKSNRDNSMMKNIVSGALLLGGLAVGVIGAGIVAHATESTSAEMKKAARNQSNTDGGQYYSEFMVPLSEIETEDDLINLVVENGTQVIVDEQSGKMYVAYVNERNEIEIAEVSEEELSALITQAVPISQMDTEEQNLIEEEGNYIPREYLRGGAGEEIEENYIPQEYWRGTNERKGKKNRKRLNSEEGREAIRKAREYKQGKK